MKTLLIILTAITLNASCTWYVNEYNNSKIRLETMQEANAPYKVTNDEKIRIVRLLENAERICDNKEYYRTLIKFYKGE